MAWSNMEKGPQDAVPVLWLAHNESFVLFVAVPTRGSVEDTCIEQPEGRRIVTSSSQYQRTAKEKLKKTIKQTEKKEQYLKAFKLWTFTDMYDQFH